MWNDEKNGSYRSSGAERRSETKPKILTFPLPNRKMMITCTSALLCENERCGQSTLLLDHLWKKNFPSALMDLENLVAMISANLWNKTRSYCAAEVKSIHKWWETTTYKCLFHTHTCVRNDAPYRRSSKPKITTLKISKRVLDGVYDHVFRFFPILVWTLNPLNCVELWFFWTLFFRIFGVVPIDKYFSLFLIYGAM